MLGALPFLALGFLLAFFRRTRGSWRDALLPGALSWGALVTLITELLSVPRALSAPGLAVAWSAVCLVVLAGSLRVRRDPPARAEAALDRSELLLLGGVCVIVLATAVVAAAAPPNTWDSMTYHMSRVAHWARNGSLAHYPTHITRQLAQPPGSEYLILHSYVLSGGDRWANVGQLLAFVGNVVMAMLIAERLGAGRRGQALAAVACATLPIALLTAASTQNDLLGGFWLLGFAYFVLSRTRAHPGVARARGDAVWMGLALGLAMLTKALTYVLAVPFLLWLVALEFRTLGWRALRPLATVALVAVAVDAGHYARNLLVFRSPIGMAEYRVQNEIHTPAALFSNVIRNVSLHLGSQVPALDAAVERAVLALHAAVGMDPQDPRTTWEGTRYAVVARHLNEDYAGNPLHLLLAMAAAGLALRRPRSALVIGLYAALLVAFLTFCAYLKWQPWHVRLHLPLFVAACALIGLSMERWPVLLARTIGAALLVSAVPYLLWNETRPLLGERSVLTAPRLQQYFASRPRLQETHARLAAGAARSGCRQIGLLMHANSWEYPLWVLLDARAADGPRLHHVRVTNPSAGTHEPGVSGPPCALFVVDRLGDDRASVSVMRRPPLDFDGDGATDMTLYHSATHLWYLRNSTTGAVETVDFGTAHAAPVAADYDGDGRSDIAVYDSSTGLWFVRSSSTGERSTHSLGGPRFAPLRGDFDGDGRADPAVHEAAGGLWFMRSSATGTVSSVQHGGSGYAPVPCDYDGDGRTDVAAYHHASGHWFLRLSQAGAPLTIGFGAPGDRPAPADFDGDGRCDLAVYRAGEGRWHIRTLAGVVDVVEQAGADALPVPADYDGDGRADPALYEARGGRWMIGSTWAAPPGPLTEFGGEGFLPAN
jgi:hypothetical protein